MWRAALCLALWVGTACGVSLRSASSLNKANQTRSSSAIPRLLILNAKDHDVRSLPPAFQKNLRHNLKLAKGLKVLFLGNEDCDKYLGAHIDEELKRFHANEQGGAAKGDICRTAVMWREGGYYIDMDLQLRLPISELVTPKTTFMAATAPDGSIQGAMTAATPRNAIFKLQLDHIRAWYRGVEPHADPQSSGELLGPNTLLRAVRDYAKTSCPRELFSDGEFRPRKMDDLECGFNVIKMYAEQGMDCKEESVDCSGFRRINPFDGVKYGFFPLNGHVVAWSRFEECMNFGCH